MKFRFLKIQLITIVVILLGVGIISGAKDPDAGRFKCIFKQGPWDAAGVGYNDGRWQATGTFTDGGLVHDDYLMVDGMSSWYTMYGRSGDLYIFVDLDQFECIGPWTLKFEGTWVITGGTGLYDGASGSGTATQIIVLAAAMNSGEYMVGGPAVSNHVVLEGIMLLS